MRGLTCERNTHRHVATNLSQKIWRPRGRFMARGGLGQYIYVAPDKDLVIVRFGEDYGYNRWPELLRSIADKASS